MLLLLLALLLSQLPSWCNADSFVQNPSISWDTNRTNILKTGTLVTTAVTADQVVLTYTVTAGKTLYLQYWNLTAGLTVVPANYNTPIVYGNVSIETPSGTKVLTKRFLGPLQIVYDFTLAEPILITGGTVVRVVCTPGITTSTTWVANLGGYEK